MGRPAVEQEMFAGWKSIQALEDEVQLGITEETENKDAPLIFGILFGRVISGS